MYHTYLQLSLQAPGHAACSLPPFQAWPRCLLPLYCSAHAGVAVPPELKHPAAMHLSSSKRQQQAFWLGACCLLGWLLLCGGAAPGTAAAGAAAGAAEEQVSNAMSVDELSTTSASAHGRAAGDLGRMCWHTTITARAVMVFSRRSLLGCYIGTATQ